MPRVVVVSNRLPVTIHPERAPPHDVEQSSGGLVSALKSVVDDYEQVVWIGWPGSFVPTEADEERFTARLREESTAITLVPVWLDQGDVEDFYNGFSNSSLWPLLHWMSPYARFKKAWAESYRRVNQQFADAVLSVAEPGDLIWVHDYHLFLLPQLLRRTRPRRRSSSWSFAREEAVQVQPRRPKDLPPPIADESPKTQGIVRFMSMGDVEGQEHPPESSVPAGKAELKKVRISQESAGEVNAQDGGPENEPSRKLKIAFFLHTPFPAFEVISVLPNCIEIVEGMLGADLVGFHTYSYLRHFRSCVTRLCGFTPAMDHVDHLGQRSKLRVFPIGANWQGISEAMRSERFVEHLRTYSKQFEGRSLVLSVERLDYSKGMPQKLAAIERYLEGAEQAQKAQRAQRQQAEEEGRERTDRLECLQKRFEERRAASGRTFLPRLKTTFKQIISRTFAAESEPLDHSRTVFLFIAVPSRQEVPEYKTIEEEVHRMISTINGRFATLTHTPIVYIHRSVSIDELAALYARADCCLVTPLVDGMNLVAKEFIAAKDRAVEKVVPGSLVLSEQAGAAQELFDALVVNPYDVDAVADAMYMGLELTKGDYLDEDLRWEVTNQMRQAVLQHDAVAWARSLLNELQAPPRPAAMRLDSSAVQLLPEGTAARFLASAPGTKAIFLDYDGTFQQAEQTVDAAVKSEAARALLWGLAARPDLRIFIMSRRTPEFLDEHFGEYEPFTLIAESGFRARGPGGKWLPFTPYTPWEWMDKVEEVMALFSRCTPGTKVERRASSVVWHYGECDDEYSQFKAKELTHQLALSIGNLPCQVIPGEKCVVVESLQVKKGVAVRTACLVQEKAHDAFSQVLCIGDDHTDESMFVEAPPSAFTVTVGFSDTYARHCLRDAKEVRRFLQVIVDQRASLSDSSAHYRSIDERVYSREGEGEEGEEDPLAGLAEQETQDYRTEGPCEGDRC